MTPQSNFMVLAPIDPAREAELRQLLALHERCARARESEQRRSSRSRSSTRCISRACSSWTTRPPGTCRSMVATRTYPLYLAFLGDIDGDEMPFSRVGRSAAEACARFFVLRRIHPRHRSCLVDESSIAPRHRELRELAWPNRAPDSRGGGAAGSAVRHIDVNAVRSMNPPHERFTRSCGNSSRRRNPSGRLTLSAESRRRSAGGSAICCT